ncbi:unnamed protein product [Ceutorhynchus assimilis]|uniref:Uncharacterized protein n=1 Tax=Ceutorhynchus assimilis TaxID=467358 RepID=A0A9N9QLL0_9CUCU|nr:unnamed protein product [Ceutorhynchus assimilis]
MDSVTNKQIFELLQQTSNDVQDIKQDVTNFKEEVEILKHRVEAVESENANLKKQLSFHEELIRKKNILAFKIVEAENEVLQDVVLDLLNNKLEINATLNDLDNFYRICENKKTNKARPILIKFTREVTVREIFKNVTKLRGTGISLAKDLLPEKRAESKTL